MNMYNLPRNVKGEGRILFVFTPKSILYTVATAILGIIFYAIFKSLGMNTVGLVILIIFALIGFLIGTAKVPGITGIQWARKNAGERLDDVLRRAVMFRQKGKRIYIYNKEEETNDK